MGQWDLNKAVRGKSLAILINISNEIHMSWRDENFAIFKIYIVNVLTSCVEIAIPKGIKTMYFVFIDFLASCYDANHYSGNLVSVLWNV